MKFVNGSELAPRVQKEALRRYVNRYTKDHKPPWARGLRPNGTPYPVQFSSDADWLANTKFYVTEEGELDNRACSCDTRPTWPDNPELRA